MASATRPTSTRWATTTTPPSISGPARRATRTSSRTASINRSAIVQDGSGNVALTRQLGDRNEADILQVGDDNLASTEVSDGIYEFGISQVGDDNDAVVEQYGDRNVARLGFLGNGNGTDANAVIITQGSAGNDVSDNQGEMAFIGNENVASADQQSSGNYLYLNARGGVTGSAQAQSGARDRDGRRSNNNTVSLVQAGSGGHVLDGFLAGSRNTITTSQTGSSNAIGTPVPTLDPNIEVARDGINVYGDDNTVLVDQSGDMNNAFIDIGANGTAGTFNTVTVDQMSSGNTATVSVNGSGNTSTTTQN